MATHMNTHTKLCGAKILDQNLLYCARNKENFSPFPPSFWWDLTRLTISLTPSKRFGICEGWLTNRLIEWLLKGIDPRGRELRTLKFSPSDNPFNLTELAICEVSQRREKICAPGRERAHERSIFRPRRGDRRWPCVHPPPRVLTCLYSSGREFKDKRNQSTEGWPQWSTRFLYFSSGWKESKLWAKTLWWRNAKGCPWGT